MLRKALIEYKIIEVAGNNCQLTIAGEQAMEKFGINFYNKKIVLIKNCLDGTERCYHIGGPLGKTLTSYFLEKKWIKKNKKK